MPVPHVHVTRMYTYLRYEREWAYVSKPISRLFCRRVPSNDDLPASPIKKILFDNELAFNDRPLTLLYIYHAIACAPL